MYMSLSAFGQMRFLLRRFLFFSQLSTAIADYKKSLPIIIRRLHLFTQL